MTFKSSFAGILGGTFAATALLMTPSTAAAQTPKTVLFKNGFSSPIYLTAPPGDYNRVFVVERAGRIKVVKDIYGTPTTEANLFLDINTLTTVVGERGLLSMAFDPNYATTGRFYIYYTNTGGNLVLARYTVSANPDIANPGGEILLTIPHPSFSNHNGGQLQFGPDGYLYMATGDGGSGNDPSNNAQTITSYLGKMLRLDVSTPTGYASPASNPYAGANPGLDEIWARGLRNPFRFAFDRNTGDLFIGDVGQDAWEEVDFQSGTYTPIPNVAINYAWRCLEGTHATNLAGCVYPNPYPNFVLPIWEYQHAGSRTVIGGYVYRGAKVPSLRGTYFFADWNTSAISGFVYTGAPVTSVTSYTAMFNPGGGLGINSIASWGQDAAGEVYLLDLNGGEVFRIEPTSPVVNGVSSFGAATPGCNGAQALSANLTPVINNPLFKISASNSPPNALSLGLITDVADVVGSDPFAIGVNLHVDMFLSNTVLGLNAPAGPSGIAVVDAPIPNAPGIVGLHFYAQVLSAWASCPLPPFGMSTSDGMDITIQP